MSAALLEEITHLAVQGKVKKLLARIVTKREGPIRAFERAGFSKVAVLENYVKDLHSQQYADIALLVKEVPASFPLDQVAALSIPKEGSAQLL